MSKSQPAIEATPRKKETVRVRSLRAISKGGDMTAAEVQAAIKLGHGLKPTLDQEIERGHLAHGKDKEGVSTYRITAAGKKALTSGTVDPQRSATKTKASKKPTKKAAKGTK